MNIWDTYSTDNFKTRYSKAALSLIFDQSAETKRPIYSLGQISLDNKKVSAEISYKSANNSDGEYYIFNSANTEVLGKISRDGSLWKYTSQKEFYYDSGANKSKLVYYFTTTTKNILYGEIWAWNLDNNIVKFKIDTPASEFYEITEEYSFDSRDAILREIVNLSFKKSCGSDSGCILSKYHSAPTPEIYFGVISYLYSLSRQWNDFLSEYVKVLIADPSYSTSQDFLEACLDLFEVYRDNILIWSNKYSQSGYSSPLEARPIYSRLPAQYQNDQDLNVKIFENLDSRFGLPNNTEIGTIALSNKGTAAYQYLPRRIVNPEERLSLGLSPLNQVEAFTPADSQSWTVLPKDNLPELPITKWVISGNEEILETAKAKIDTFPNEILDPETCDPGALDWLAQFFGFTSGVWKEEWEPEQKRAILLNSMGWYDSELFSRANDILDETVPTLKGRVTNLAPFNFFPENWIDSEEYNLYSLDLEKIAPTLKTFDTTEQKIVFTEVENFTVSKQFWQGLHASKGTLLCLIWWLSLFKINGCNKETEINNNRVNQYFSTDFTPSLCKPIVLNQMRAANNEQTSCAAVAGDSVIKSAAIVVPISFIYPRSGEEWKNLEYVNQYWMPIVDTPRIQYQYLASDLFVANDVFFEYEQ